MNSQDINQLRYQAIVDHTFDGIIVVSAQQEITFANPAANQLFCYDDLVGLPLSDLIPDKFKSKHDDYVDSFRDGQTQARPMHLRAGVKGVTKTGQEISLEVTLAKITVDGRHEMMAIIRNMSETSELLRDLNIAAHTDPLTGLKNRRFTEPLVEKEWTRFVRYGHAFSLLFLDLDHFKRVNDIYGHAAGDVVLQTVAGIIGAHVRASDTLCRWGGEEFLILLPESTQDQACIIAEKIRRAVEEMVVTYDGQAIRLTISIGVATSTNSDHGYQALIDKTDDNLYQAKKQGRNRVIS